MTYLIDARGSTKHFSLGVQSMLFWHCNRTCPCSLLLHVGRRHLMLGPAALHIAFVHTACVAVLHAVVASSDQAIATLRYGSGRLALRHWQEGQKGRVLCNTTRLVVGHLVICALQAIAACSKRRSVTAQTPRWFVSNATCQAIAH
jgi:hypothetical protein